MRLDPRWQTWDGTEGHRGRGCAVGFTTDSCWGRGSGDRQEREEAGGFGCQADGGSPSPTHQWEGGGCFRAFPC